MSSQRDGFLPLPFSFLIVDQSLSNQSFQSVSSIKSNIGWSLDISSQFIIINNLKLLDMVFFSDIGPWYISSYFWLIEILWNTTSCNAELCKPHHRCYLSPCFLHTGQPPLLSTWLRNVNTRSLVLSTERHKWSAGVVRFANEASNKNTACR